MIFGLWLAVLGVLGASSIIIAKKPDAKELIGKLAPYQGWIGAISCVWGVWGIISSILTLGWLSLPGGWKIWWITRLADSVVLAALGLILGIGVLKTFIKNPQAQAKMDETLAKLLPYQGNLGLLSIGLGIWCVVGSFILI